MNIKSIIMGYPTLEKTKDEIISALKNEEIIEFVIPFSDIMTNSAQIQQMNDIALENKISIDDIFKILSSLEINKKAIISSYINPVFRFGYDNFFKKCKENNIKFVNIYDLPRDEIGEIEQYLKKYNVEAFDNNLASTK